MVYRIYTEHRAEFRQECAVLAAELRADGLGGFSDLRIVRRYFVEGIDYETFSRARYSVFCHPQTDDVSDVLPCADADHLIFRELLPGQPDRTAEAISLQLALDNNGHRPVVRATEIFAFYGKLSRLEFLSIRRRLLDPLLYRETDDSFPDTLEAAPIESTRYGEIDGFLSLPESQFSDFIGFWKLGMSENDLLTCQKNFAAENRCPTETELRILDAFYRIIHRKGLFRAPISEITIRDSYIRDTFENYLEKRETLYAAPRPVTLSDISSLYARYLHRTGGLDDFEPTSDPGVCTFRIPGKTSESDLRLVAALSDENTLDKSAAVPSAEEQYASSVCHLTAEGAEPFHSIRIACGNDPDLPDPSIGERHPIPERILSVLSAQSTAAYARNSDIPLNRSAEICHPGYAVRRFETTLSLGISHALPQTTSPTAAVRPGDMLILIGAPTGRDACCYPADGPDGLFSDDSFPGTQTPLGQPDVGRRLSRFMMREDCREKIRASSAVGHGGLAVAVGLMTEGATLHLDQIRCSHRGLSDTEIALSETPGRMILCVRRVDVPAILSAAEEENLDVCVMASVTADKCLKAEWNGHVTARIPFSFIPSTVDPLQTEALIRPVLADDLSTVPHAYDMLDIRSAYISLLSDINLCLRPDITDPGDATQKDGSPLAADSLSAVPYSLSYLPGSDHTLLSVTAFGHNPYLCEKSPYHGAAYATIEALAKVTASGADWRSSRLIYSFLFENPRLRSESFGRCLASVLGAYCVQSALGIPAVGGRPSMTGSYENRDVPPTALAAALAVSDFTDPPSPSFDSPDHNVYLIEPLSDDETMLPVFSDLARVFDYVGFLIRSGAARSVRPVGYGGVADALFRMGAGSGIGVHLSKDIEMKTLFSYRYGAFLVETDREIKGDLIGVTIPEPILNGFNARLDLAELIKIASGRSDSPSRRILSEMTAEEDHPAVPHTLTVQRRPAAGHGLSHPAAVIPLLPYTTGEYAFLRRFSEAGADASFCPLRFHDPEALKQSCLELEKVLREAQILVLPDGCEPNGLGGYAASLLRVPRIREACMQFLDRDGLILGVGDGFSALLQTGLLPYGKILDDLPLDAPVLTDNPDRRPLSRFVRVLITSVRSPWFAAMEAGTCRTLPVCHRFGRFASHSSLLNKLNETGQIAARYADAAGVPVMNLAANPFLSDGAVESITSPSGRILGCMTHPERIGDRRWRNLPDAADTGLFRSAVRYFTD